ncbi:MAG: acyl-ACP--UDP-N-acetylglucosamine O-acyltransferase [Leptospirales bacterium]
MSPSLIHPTALVDSNVELGEGVTIGPFCIVRGPSRIGDGTTLMERVSICPGVEMGKDNRIHMGAVIGHEPQDRAYAGQFTRTRIGNGNEIREYVTIHRATKEGTETVLGDQNLLMAQSHVAHNCHIGNQVILANGALLAGHVRVDDQAFLSGAVLVHQFVRVGRLSLLRGGARTSRDVPPFCIIDGTHTVRTLNRIGLRRAGYSPEEIGDLKKSFREIFLDGPLKKPLIESISMAGGGLSRELSLFILSSRKGVCHARAFVDKAFSNEYD